MKEIDTTLKMPLPEQIIAGRYRIVTRLGSGGMGLVFLAEQLGVGRKVALKFLDPEPSEDASRLERFLQEAKVGIAVQHPNATQVLDLGQDEAGRLFVAFEHVEGEDLREVLKREGRLRWSEARAIALQVAQVLAFAHERGIVHRDIKPENIRVRRDLGMTHVKLLDFGIARMLKKNGVRLTAEGALAGTPRYMSPEQVNDEAIDGRVDQYALGLVLYEMLTGAVAIGGKNVTQILVHQLQTLVPPLAWADPELGHPVVDAFIARACAKARDERFPAMAEFITALQALQVDERAWPPPRAGLPGPVGSSEPTKDGTEPPASGLSDTFVRPRITTDPEPRLAVNRELREPRTEPMVKAVPRPEAATVSKPPGATTLGGETEPVLLRPSRVLELPTDPERPAVLRQPVRLTVRGD
ncbi:MAG TPA: serine/threonine-protein kinase, partial [Archangium sp.]